MTTIQKVLLTGKTHTTASRRDGASRGGETSLDIQLSTPNDRKLVHKFKAIQPHPTAEQLFAGGWSACYFTALGLVAKKRKVALPADRAVDIEVDLGMTGDAYLLQARLNVSLPGVTGGRTGAGGRRGPDLPVLQGNARQHRRAAERPHRLMQRAAVGWARAPSGRCPESARNARGRRHRAKVSCTAPARRRGRELLRCQAEACRATKKVGSGPLAPPPGGSSTRGPAPTSPAGTTRRKGII